MRKLPHILLAIAIVLSALASCSTKKNTGATRWWHSFTARYNTYFNGHEAFLEGEKAKENGHKDNYTELLPVFLVGAEKSRTTGKSNFETAITKCQKAIQLHSIKRRPVMSAGKKRTAKVKAYLQRKEFNPFLKNAWLLMGEAQFEKGEFLEAAATFSYITRLYAAQPEVASEARQWMARCYVQTGWLYDADDALQRVRRDTATTRTLREADLTQADLLLRQQRYADALPLLQSAARRAKGKLQRARLHFLTGQVCQLLDRPAEARRAYGKCISMSPPFELAFNARIRQTEAMAAEGAPSRKMIGKLRRMARSETNKDYLDQVYYAIGNIYLSDRDTLAAVRAYESGRSKSTRAGVEKGVLSLRLGEIYWTQRRFDRAQECYTEAIGLIGKQHEGYDEVKHRSAVLDKLVPFTSAVALQDSLQELSRMSEKDRNAAIDRVIDALRRREAEERRAKADSAAEARAQENGMGQPLNGNNSATRPGQNQQRQQQATWYFYDQQQVMQGKQDFRRHWGNRKNEDNWRRSNRTILAADDGEAFDYAADDSLRAAADSLAAADGAADAPAEEADSAADPHSRAYYMKDIPFTAEARAASDAIIMDALHQAGVIEKDDLGDFQLAEESLGRVVRQYPAYEQLPEVYYQLFLLYSRWGRTDRAAEMRSYMAAHWPDNEHTRTITAPDYEQLARYGREMEDSLYTATYDAYRQRDNETVERNFARSTEKFPRGVNRPKFMLVHVLSRLQSAPTAELTAELRELVTQWPEADVTPLAGSLLKGLESGRKVGSGTYDIGSLWSRRAAAADSTQAEAARQRTFSPERQGQFLFVLAYPTDSVDSNRLLYEMAHFNFTTFVARGFDMALTAADGVTQFRVSGFRSFDEAHAYAQRVFAAADLAPFTRKARVLLVSKDNLDLIGTTFSYDDWQRFYDIHFAPVKLPATLPLDDTPPVRQRYEDELPDGTSQPSEGGNDDGTYYDDSDTTTDDGEWYSE